ncbi:MAG TPA: polyprenyl diphosphate synthase [Gammaproteobacteria bacterium]|nr:polyprenyl diphosphate synthase [Gammaproteobacteria bacterium]
MLDGNPEFYSPTTRSESLPRHVAIIMDGNGRWANKRHLPRIAGHRAGLRAVRRIVESCARKGIEGLTVFAFSSENWRRPEREVKLLMDLFLTALQREVSRLHDNGIRLRIIGDRAGFSDKIRRHIDEAERLTAGNARMTLTVAANYGGQWDVTQAARTLAERVEAGELQACDITADMLQACLALQELPEPDFFIRTGGEQRISNFLLWQLAYTELYFTDILWPDFGDKAFDAALTSYAKRQRRFGQTGEQVERATGA